MYAFIMFFALLYLWTGKGFNFGLFVVYKKLQQLINLDYILFTTPTRANENEIRNIVVK